MAAEIKSEHPEAEVILIEGERGVFDVAAGERVVYQKSKACGNFPAVGEVNRLLRRALFTAAVSTSDTEQSTTGC